MTEADILATTYEDTVTVYRAFKDTLPGGESVFKSGLDGKVVYEDVECALSTHTGGKLQQSKSTAKTETTFCLFTRPEVDNTFSVSKKHCHKFLLMSIFS